MTTKIINREDFLEKATELMKPLFKDKGYNIPLNLRVSCSFPSTRGLSAKQKAIGECWDSSASDENKYNVFISPTIDDKWLVLSVLVHELVHATVGLKNGHNHIFKKCATALGLEGKMTATTFGETFKQLFKNVFNSLPKYDYKKINGSNRKKQSTRLLKVVCANGTGFVGRFSKGSLNNFGFPKCPCCDEKMILENTE